MDAFLLNSQVKESTGDSSCISMVCVTQVELDEEYNSIHRLNQGRITVANIAGYLLYSEPRSVCLGREGS